MGRGRGIDMMQVFLRRLGRFSAFLLDILSRYFYVGQANKRRAGRACMRAKR